MKKVKPTPVMVKSYTLEEIMNKVAQRKPSKLPTPAEQAEIDALIEELSKDPGFMIFRMGK